jgi:quercetin dioxygenase-like cupin family protein
MDAPRDVSDPTSGQRWVFKRTGAETNGELLEADLYVSPGGFVRSHMHPTQEEAFTGVEGTFVLDVAGETRAVGPGETVVIPARTPHGFRKAREAAQLQVTMRPALALDDYFRAYLGLSRDGRIRVPGVRPPDRPAPDRARHGPLRARDRRAAHPARDPAGGLACARETRPEGRPERILP